MARTPHKGIKSRIVRGLITFESTSSSRALVGKAWTCGLEFDYANPESFIAGLCGVGEGKTPERMPIPEEAASTQIAFLPPMSGLAATETRLDKAL